MLHTLQKVSQGRISSPIIAMDVNGMVSKIQLPLMHLFVRTSTQLSRDLRAVYIHRVPTDLAKYHSLTFL